MPTIPTNSSRFDQKGQVQTDVWMVRPINRISIDDQSLEDLGMKRYVETVEVILNDETSDYCKVVIENPNLGFSDDVLFSEGKEIELSLGHSDTPVEFVGKFILKEPEFFFTRTGKTRISLIGYGEEIKMAQNEERKIWKNIKDSDIAKQLASKYGFKGDIESTEKEYRQISQINITDFEFLKERAVLYGYQVYLRDGKLHFHKPKVQLSETSLHFRQGSVSNLESCKVHMSTYKKGVEVKKTNINPLNAEVTELSSEVKKDPIQELELKTAGLPLQSFEEITERPVRFLVGAGHYRDEEETRTQVDSIGLSKSFIAICRGIATGNSLLKPADTVEINGIGRFSGKWYIKEVRHVQPEFRTHFLAARQFTRDLTKTSAVSLITESSSGTRAPVPGGSDDITSRLKRV